MKRDLTKLSNKVFDLLIVGGGIYGACAAWDAALRGLSVVLIDKGDFGHATSANSLKIIHGGFRYLQHGDIKRMRESIRERMILMRIAPHLIHPLPCIIPTYGYKLHSKASMFFALRINDLIGLDRNSLKDPQKFIPGGRIISKKELTRLIPVLNTEEVTGGAIWHDCQVYNSERLTLSFIISAANAGSITANYVKAENFIIEDRRVLGVMAEDVLTGDKFDIRAKLVVNTAGPWVNDLIKRQVTATKRACPELVEGSYLSDEQTKNSSQKEKLLRCNSMKNLKGNFRAPETRFAKAINLVVRPQIISKLALGIHSVAGPQPKGLPPNWPTKTLLKKHSFASLLYNRIENRRNNLDLNKGSQILFMVPWRDCTLIGTKYKPFYGAVDDCRVTEEEIQTFLNEINDAYPGVSIKLDEVSFFHVGIIPIDGIDTKTGQIRLKQHYEIIDHLKQDGIDGLISVIGVKLTTARGIAEKTIDMVFKKMGKKSPVAITDTCPIWGGDIEKWNAFVKSEIENKPDGLDEETIRQLIYNYGSRYREVLKYFDKDIDQGKTLPDSKVLKAQILYAVREEMAQKLADIVLRRTELGTAGNPGYKCLEISADIMSSEMGWNKERAERELNEVKASYSPNVGTL